MATGTRALTLKLLADVDNFTKNLDKADKDVSGFGDKVTKFGKVAGLAFAAAGAAAVAYAGKLAIDGVKSAIEDEAAQAKLASTLRNVTQATDDQIKSTEEFILQTSLATGVADDELRPSLDRLTRATKDVDKAQQLQNLALDIAAGSGKSLQAVTESLSKAQEGNLAGLSRLGVGITKAELATLSFDEITAKLSGTFANQASKQAETFQGKMARLQVAFNEAKETVGSYILDAVTPMVDLIVKKVIPAVQTFIDSIGGEKGLNGAFSNYIDAAKRIFIPILDGLKSAFNSIKDAVMRNKDEFETLFNFLKDYVGPLFGGVLKVAIQGIGFALAAVLDTVGLLIKGFEKVIDLVKGFIDISKSIGSGIGNFFSGASFSGATSPAAPMAPMAPAAPAPVAPSVPRYIYASTGGTNITVNGAIDSESTARQIVGLLNDSSARGTLGGSGLLFA
jgi:hypothetical protein